MSASHALHYLTVDEAEMRERIELGLLTIGVYHVNNKKFDG